MSNVAKLKKKAAELEERRQYDKALAIYEQVLDQMSSSEEDVDVSLFNRVGDLTLRQGRVTQAVAYYERAVDLYTEGGFFNNAIALCNKILRNAPGRTAIYYKLGKISARKGFTSDAKQNFLEYADRMQKAGQWDDAFSALEEFANLCPDQDDVRLMLAEQLTRQERKPEALAQLQILYGRYTAEGRTTEANAALERMKALDPDVVPQLSQQAAPEQYSGLVFLDINYDEPTDPGNDPFTTGVDREVVNHSPQPTSGGSRGDALGRQDPRASGSMRIVDPADMFNRSLTPEDISLMPDGVGVEPGLLANFPTLEDGGPTETSVAGPPETNIPLHDLALAGILPDLGTPGSEPVFPEPPPELIELDEIEPEELGQIESGGEVQNSGLRYSEGDHVSADTDAGAGETYINMPILDRPPDQELRVSDVAEEGGLGIVHGAGPAGGSSGNTGAASLASLLETMSPGKGVLELNNSLSRESLKSIATSAAELQVLLKDEPDDFNLHRRLGEVLIEDGDRASGLASLDVAMLGFEGVANVSTALAVAEEILRLEPDSIRHHQKRVEYAYRSSDKALLLDAYLELADALFRSSHLAKAAVVYERVQELAPGNDRATYALAALFKDKGQGSGTDEIATAVDPLASLTLASQGGAEVAPVPLKPDTVVVEESFVNLGDLLREDDEPRTTRMVVEEEAPTGDEDADFQDMLEKFKRGLAENVDDEDYESHYDLGVAFREMGLLDEAIAQFQRALRGTSSRVKTLEALGQCFVERSQFQVAINVLSRALTEDGAADENLVGVLYLLGYASEAMQKYSEALAFYQRVFMVDIQFRDVTGRIGTLEKLAQ